MYPHQRRTQDNDNISLINMIGFSGFKMHSKLGSPILKLLLISVPAVSVFGPLPNSLIRSMMSQMTSSDKQGW